jgi:hypothetical protein
MRAALVLALALQAAPAPPAGFTIMFDGGIFKNQTFALKPFKGYRLDLDVTVTKLEPPGGRIEGTFRGRYELCTLRGDGGGNCTARAPLTIAGTFAVIRGKDRVID